MQEKPKGKQTLLKVVVGSRAHGLNREDSDWDYRAIYVEPTAKILSLGYKYSGTSWDEGDEDNTAYEIGHFLNLATKANPSVLEILRSDSVMETTPWGKELQDLFPKLFNPTSAFNAFVGYSSAQRRKLLDNKDGRGPKFALAYYRTIINLEKLLQTGTFDLRVTDQEDREVLIDIRDGRVTPGVVIDLVEPIIRRCTNVLLPMAKNHHEPNAANEFLLRIRRAHWE